MHRLLCIGRCTFLSNLCNISMRSFPRTQCKRLGIMKTSQRHATQPLLLSNSSSHAGRERKTAVTVRKRKNAPYKPRALQHKVNKSASKTSAQSICVSTSPRWPSIRIYRCAPGCFPREDRRLLS